MEELNKPITILNLADELSEELSAYFASRGLVLASPSEGTDEHDWTHILTKDVHDFSELNKTYSVTEKNRNIISLTQVNDLQNFTVNNGNLIIGDLWFKTEMGNFILDKYFQSSGGLSISENYPSFNEIGSFNVANPFNTGEYLDQLVHRAFENGASALTIKTFFDHLMMYVTGLKNKGKAGLPFEVTYGVYEDIFAVQVHFFSDQLKVMDVATSLSSQISKKAEEYYLNVAVQAADFFDFSYMPQVNKVIVTALWSKDERINFENRGLMFSSLVGGLPLANYENEGATSSIVSAPPVEDFSEKVIIPDTLSEAVENSLVKGFTEDGEEPIIVKGQKPGEESNTVVSGSIDKNGFVAKLISEAQETEDEIQIIKGGDLLEELAQTVKGKFENEKNVVRISQEKIDIDKVAYTIASKVDESAEEKNLRVRSLGGTLPQSIKTGLFDFAKVIGKEVDSLNDHDLDRFQLQKVPEIIKKELRLLAEKDKKEVSTNDGLMRQAEAKLNAANVQNEKLKNQLKTMAAEVRILKDTRNKLAEIQMKVKEASADIAIKADDDDELRRQFQIKLFEQKTLNEMELKKLSALLERETKLIADLKQEEMKGRKLQLEASQKEIYFSQEIEKVQRQMKGKDLILIKSKETFTKLIDKKDKELADMKAKLDQLSRLAANSNQSKDAIALRDMEKQNQNLLKQIEGYKSKISTLTANMRSSKSEDSMKDEVRKLQMQNQQMKNQLDLSKKEYDKLMMKASLESSQIGQLRLEKVKAEEALKKLQAEMKSPVSGTAMANHQNDAELKRLQAQNQILDSQAKEAQSKVTQLEAKIVELSKPQRGANAGDDNSKVKLAQLENSVKKLTQDLLAAKNQLTDEKKETNKLRQEKTALQNQVDKLKKEASKAKTAAPKKPGKAA